MNFDSDLDVVIDFPTELEADAFDFVEHACRRQNLPADVRLESRAGDRFLDRIRSRMIPLP